MLTTSLILWMAFAIGAAALIPGVAALLRRTAKTVYLQRSVSIESSPEQVVEMLRSSSLSEAVAELQKLISALEADAIEESRVVNDLIRDLLKEAERIRRRDLLLMMSGWFVSALCCMVLMLFRSNLSVLLACIWSVLFIILLGWNAWEWIQKRFKFGSTKVEQHKQNFVK